MATPTVLITGSSSGIGKALCQSFHRRGYQVIATARQPESITDLQAEGMLVLPLDVTEAVAVERTLEQVMQICGRLDVLVNNAGYGQFGPLLDLPIEALREQFETNVFAPLRLARQVAPIMRQQGAGLIVNIGSISGLVTTPFAGAYCGSKAALHALSDALRLELRPFGIRVITVQPGAIESNFGEAATAALNQQRQTDSWYVPLQQRIQARAALSQTDATPAQIFAEQLVDRVTQSQPPGRIRLGKKSRWLPLLQHLLPAALFEYLLCRQFGLVPTDWVCHSED